MALNNDPNFPPSGPAPYFINREWCIGDSLTVLNNNANNFDTRILNLSSNIDTKVSKSGDTMTGALNATGFVAGGATASIGRVELQQGTNIAPGYVAWYRPDGTTRVGYMGWNPGGVNDLSIVLENGANFKTFDGQMIIHPPGFGNNTLLKPPNWGGGLTTWDIYSAGGTIGAGVSNGAVRSFMNAAGDMGCSNAFYLRERRMSAPLIWANWNGQNMGVRGAINVSSVTRSSTGNYRINFSTALEGDNYCAQWTPGITGTGGGGPTHAQSNQSNVWLDVFVSAAVTGSYNPVWCSASVTYI